MTYTIITQPLDTKLLPTRNPEQFKLEIKILQWYSFCIKIYVNCPNKRKLFDWA